MKLLTYVVARDYGFAPNPFHGYCTLATCKPVIRRVAQPGDWVVGTGSARGKRVNRLVYAMRVAETLAFDEYWADPRFRSKRPNLHGSKKQAFGDNIYRSTPEGWHQANSHHSMDNGTPNPRNIANDTQTNRVLVASEYVYWGGSGPFIPEEFHPLVCDGRGHRCKFPEDLAARFIDWLRRDAGTGYQGEPLDWRKSP